MDKIKPGFVVFATDDTKYGILEARAWLKEKKLTPDQVRLYRHNGQTLVEALKPISIAPSAPDTLPEP